MTYKDAPKERLSNAYKLSKELKEFNTEVYLGGTRYLDNMYNVFKSNIGKDDLLMLEDDVYLCDNFIDRVEKAKDEFPDTVINFFNLHYNTKEPLYMSFTQWTECQCYFVPRRLLAQLSLYYKAFIKLAPKSYECNIADNYMRYCLRENYVLYYPSLVQQYPFNSVIFEGRIDTQSKTFLE